MTFLNFHVHVYHSHILYPQLPEDFAVVYSQVQGEIVVGGVFLRLFIAQPTWVGTTYIVFLHTFCMNWSCDLYIYMYSQVLRKPKEFLIALLEKFGQLTQSTSPDVRKMVAPSMKRFYLLPPSLSKHTHTHTG